MVGRTACAALAVLLSPLVGCLLTTELDNLESGAGGMSGSGGSTASTTAATGGAAGSSTGGAGGGPIEITVLAEEQEKPEAIALDGEWVYFSTRDSFIKRVPKGGGDIEFIASGHFLVSSMAFSDQFMWWSVYNTAPLGAIWRADKDGANAQELVPNQSLPTEVALSGRYLYWNTTGFGGQIRRADATTGAGNVLVEDTEVFFFTLQADWLYFTTNYTSPGPTGQVWAVSLSSPQTRIAIDQGVLKPAAIAADATRVVWAQEGDGVVATASPPSYPVSTIHADGVAPLDVALDGATIYWTDPGAGRVMKVTNGDETVLADDQVSPRNIAVDATSVYWTDNESGMVLKAPK